MQTLRMSSKEKRELENMDEEMNKVQGQMDAIDIEMEACSDDFVKLNALSDERAALEQKLEEMMERWEYLSEKQQKIENMKQGKA